MKRTISFVLAVVLVLFFVGCKSKSPVATMEKFEQIESGMSYEEVSAIAGSSGKLISEGESETIKIQIYEWDGSAPGASMVISFYNDEVTSKAQTGLE